MMQYVVACCGVLQCATERCSELNYVAVCCALVAVCCGVLQRVAVCYKLVCLEPL